MLRERIIEGLDGLEAQWLCPVDPPSLEANGQDAGALVVQKELDPAGSLLRNTGALDEMLDPQGASVLISRSLIRNIKMIQPAVCSGIIDAQVYPACGRAHDVIEKAGEILGGV